ncbi:hypothetical protein ACFYZ9_38615 [Streptomyces sp. NPDC001691]|uniref:hypothetical protein n=1 Tax=Streptomyces sp. NPDC001691 TaxID=3364600 RepID=UPI0036ACE8D6
MDLCRSVQLNDPELPALMVQYADECLAFKSQANSRRDVAEAMLLVACLTTAGQARASSEAAQESVNDHVYGTAMVFLDHFGIESLDFLQMQGLTERNIGTGIRPWSCLEDFESRIPDDLFSPSL